jgi:hypothetical protein
MVNFFSLGQETMQQENLWSSKKKRVTFSESNEKLIDDE